MPEASVGQSIIIVFESYIARNASTEDIGRKAIVERGKNWEKREMRSPRGRQGQASRT